MKLIKNTLLVIFIMILLLLSFRGSFYRNLVTYKSLGFKNKQPAYNHELVQYLNGHFDRDSKPTIEEIIDAGLSATSSQLDFTFAKSDVNPNLLIYSKKAHCVGYANFFTTSINYFIKKYKLESTWEASSQIGQLYFLGINLHNYFKSPFFKDHDFVVIKNKKTGQTFAVDPTVHDYFNIDFITYKQ